jgi:hypothetical protein
VSGAPAVSIGRLSATTHLEEGRGEDAGRVARMLGRVAAERLGHALGGVALPPGIWCVRHLDVTVGLDLNRPDPALEAAWAETLAVALRQTLQPGSPEVVRYDHERDALGDLVGGVATGRLGPAWAWRRLGLLQPADPPLDREPGEALVAVLDRRPRQALGAVLVAAERVGLAALQRVLGPAGWTAVAGVVRDALGAGPPRPGRDGDPGAAGRPVRAAALVEGSRLAGLARGSRVRLDPRTLDALALLVVAERDPSALRHPAGEALVAAVAGALAARVPGAGAHPVPDPGSTGRRADEDPGPERPAAPDPVVSAPPPEGAAAARRATEGPPDPGQPAAAGAAGVAPGAAAADRAGAGPPAPAGRAGESGEAAAGRAGAGSGAAAAGRAGEGSEDPPGQARGGDGEPAAAGARHPEGAPPSPGAQPWPRGNPASRREAPRWGSGADGEPTGARLSTAPGGATASGGATARGGATAPGAGATMTPGAGAGTGPDEVGGEAATVAAGGVRGRPTDWAGLLFLLATADRAGIPDAVLDDPALASRPLPWALQGIALRLVPTTADDPAVAAFAAVDPDGSPPWWLGPPAGDDELDRLERIAGRWAAVTAAALEETARDPLEVVASITRRGGVIDHAPGWLEVHLDINRVDVAVRRAGLDLDPGWVPWLGTVVRFVYA